MARPTKKRKLSSATTNNTASTSQASTDAPITNARELQNLTSDYTGAGLRRFRDFLRTAESDAEDAARNRGLLKEYLETYCRNVGTNEEEEGGNTAFADFTQIWGWASQNNSINILSILPATLALLVRLCSHHEALRPYGKILVKSLLQPNTLKIVYKSISGNRDHVSSPCLRLLTEMNRFEYGAMCPTVHGAFDFTVKELPRHLEVRGAAAKAEVEEDPTKPSVRTLLVRFFLSFLQNGSSSVKNEMMGLRNWVSPIFKYIKMDAPGVIVDLLEVMRNKVLNDKEIPRQTKTNVFNEWVLGHIAELYTREEIVKIRVTGKDEETTVAKVTHEFLLTLCTSIGNGICFADRGWFPPGFVADASSLEEKRPTNNNSPKVYNRTLSSFLYNIRPFADPLQLDLLLAIFCACPELAADYFLSNSSFSFDPKLTSTWVGYCTLLQEAIALEVPVNFGLKEKPLAPPPVSVIIENILPKPLTKVVVTKCLSHENGLIVFLTTRLLIVAFQKLRKVLDAMNDTASTIYDPQGKWAKATSDLLEEFCRRAPDIAAVTGLLGSGKSVKTTGVLQMEARMRLLAKYYAELPEIALAGKFDIDAALGKYLATFEAQEAKEDDGMRLLATGHLLVVAKAVPDAKWWNKYSPLPHSPFVSILKLCCTQSGIPLGEIRELLQYFVAASYLFQTETTASPIDALLESLSSVESILVLEPILSLLDEAVARCVRTPFKYLDDCGKIMASSREITSGTVTSLASPLLMVLVEQWPFFIKGDKLPNETKLAASKWLKRLLESCVLLGENSFVVATLCDRLAESSPRKCTEEFLGLKGDLESVGDLQIISIDNDSDAPSALRAVFVSLKQLRIDNLPVLVERARYLIDVSIFDLVVIQKAAASMVLSATITPVEKTEYLRLIMELMEIIAIRLLTLGGETADKAKNVLANSGPCLEMFLKLCEGDNLTTVIAFSEGYAKLVTSVFGQEDMLEGKIVEQMRTFCHSSSKLSREDSSKVLSIYRCLAPRLPPIELVPLMEELCSGPEVDGVRSELLGYILRILKGKEEMLPSITVNKILGSADNLPENLAQALADFLSNTAPKFLEEIHIPISGVDPMVECALIKKLPRVRDSTLSHIDRELRQGRVRDGLAYHVSALLEAYSVPTIDVAGKTFDWDPATSPSIRAQLENIFSAAQDEILTGSGSLGAAQISLLSRAVAIFPLLDHEQILKRVAIDRKRDALGAQVVRLVGMLAKSSKDMETQEMKSWLLMSFDHLTRRFAEDSVLSDKTISLVEAIGDLLAQKKIDLSKALPRAAVNAVLEAGLQKHIFVLEVIQFAAIVVSDSSVKYLDVTKLLQMILGHSENPLTVRDSHVETSDLHSSVAYLIYKLFSLGKAQLSNVATLDGIMELYRGSNHAVDEILLDIMVQIEGRLARSCAGRITSWTITENADTKPLIFRTRGRLNITIDGKTLARSVWQFAPQSEKLGDEQYVDFKKFLEASKHRGKPESSSYNWQFMLPALAYCLVEGHVDAQTAVEYNCVAFAITGLCSLDSSVRTMASRYLSAVVSKLEGLATYRPKNQICHLLCALLAALDIRNQQKQEPVPSIIGLFLAQASQIATNPAHFLYGAVMTFLLRRPLLDLDDLPTLLNFKEIGEENWHKELFWKLNILSNGLKTYRDLELLRKRNVFMLVMVLYSNPSVNEKCKEKVLELLWNAAGIEGGATMLITRLGAVGWVNGLLSSAGSGSKTTLERLHARLAFAADRGYLKEWSRGSFLLQFKGLVEENC